MGLEVCSCDVVLGNTGQAGCKKTYQVAKYLILQSILGSDGLANSFDVSAGEPTLADIQAGLNAPDALDRLFPLGGLETVTNERLESIFQEFDSGKKVKVRDGFKSFTGFLPKAQPELVGKIKKSACSNIGAYIVDASGNFIFSAQKSDGIINTAFPIQIDTDTMDVRFVESTDGTIFGIMIEFQWAESEKDSYLRQVTPVDWTSNDLNGLVDVNSVNSAISVTQFDVLLVTDYGDPVEGLLIGDMALAEISPTPASIVITTVTESAITAGLYTVVYPAESSADVLELTITKNGFDFTKVTDNTILIP